MITPVHRINLSIYDIHMFEYMECELDAQWTILLSHTTNYYKISIRKSFAYNMRLDSSWFGVVCIFIDDFDNALQHRIF